MIETYLSTFDKTQESIVPFILFPRQKEIIWCYEHHRHNLITKPRQAGVSTTTAAYMGVKVGLASDKNPESVLIVANKQDLAFEFLKKIRDFLSQLPRWVWGPEYYGNPKNEAKSIFITDAKGEITLPNKSRVKAVATSEDALRGFTPTFLIMDEAAHITNGKDLFSAALMALGTGGKAILISTPNGMDELYYKTYAEAKAKNNNFNVVEMKWYEDSRYNKNLRWVKKVAATETTPEIDEEVDEVEFTFESYSRKVEQGYKPYSSWYDHMCQSLNNDTRMIAQELDVSFIGSGGNVIKEEDIEFQVKHNVRLPIATAGFEDSIWIWAHPEEGHQYIMGSDVSRGDGEDSSTMVIVDVTTMEQVVEFKGQIPPDLLAELLEEWGLKYGAYIVVDITGGMGVPTVLKLLEFEYKHLHYDTVSGKIFSQQQKKIRAKSKDNKTPGFTVGAVRGPMIANFEMLVRLDRIKIRSVRLTTEMKTFVYKNGRPDHMDGYHDDLIFAIAMALWVYEHSFTKLKKLDSQVKAILSCWGGSQNMNPAIAAQMELEKGTAFVPKSNRNIAGLPKPKFSPLVAKNMQDPTGNYLWLFSGSK